MDWDGNNELILGTYGNTLLVYKAVAPQDPPIVSGMIDGGYQLSHQYVPFTFVLIENYAYC